MNNISQFDIATAALEHLELLNQSNQNPLEIAAQFRTLLRSKKNNKNEHSSKTDYTYMDYITTDATIRRQGCSHNLVDYQSKSLSGLHSSDDLPKHQNINSIDQNNQINRFHYPTINWKQLRKKQYKHKLQQFISTKFKPKDLTQSSLTTVSDKIDSYTYSDISEIRKSFEEMNSSRSTSPTIRTPSISPINFPQPTYTISRLNSTSINHEDIFFPIADCNLIIKHKPKRISCKTNDRFCNSNTEKTICI
jgi:hypothetical protein